MPFKPVGVDENGHFPPRVQEALFETFVTVPVGIGNGQVPVWDSATQTWLAGSGGGGSGGWTELPPAIDGGIYDPPTNTWIHGSGNWDSPPSVDGGTPAMG